MYKRHAVTKHRAKFQALGWSVERVKKNENLPLGWTVTRTTGHPSTPDACGVPTILHKQHGCTGHRQAGGQPARGLDGVVVARTYPIVSSSGGFGWLLVRLLACLAR